MEQPNKSRPGPRNREDSDWKPFLGERKWLFAECKLILGECKSKVSECKSKVVECKSKASECKPKVSECKSKVSECKRFLDAGKCLTGLGEAWFTSRQSAGPWSAVRPGSDESGAGWACALGLAGGSNRTTKQQEPTMATNKDANTPPPEPSPTPEEKAKAQRAEQDQQIANDITETAEMIGVTQKDAAIATAMAGKGYDDEELTVGLGLQGAAEAAFGERQKAMAKQEAGALAFTLADKSARQSYADFRETARVKYAAAADQTALGLKGAVPRDLQKFITTAKSSYQAAFAQPYCAELAKAGLTPEQITERITALGTLKSLNEDLRVDEGAATAATKTRNAAYKAMMKWVRGFRRMAKMALRGQPALKTKLKL